jgi:nucleotide-binding universal stress UspA family protein
MTFRRILIAVDGTDSSSRGVRAGAALAARFGAEIVVVTAVDVPHQIVKAAGMGRGGLEEYVERMGRDSLRCAVDILAEYKVGAAIKILVGPAAETIVAEAARPGTDLVVMGRRGRTEPKDLVLGSVSDRVARNVTIPILLIP